MFWDGAASLLNRHINEKFLNNKIITMSKEELEQENIELRQKIAELQDLLEQCKVLLESLDLKKILTK